MKSDYEKPEIEIVNFETSDVITSSGLSAELFGTDTSMEWNNIE